MAKFTKPRKPRKVKNIPRRPDTAWFDARMAERGWDRNALAKLLGLHPDYVWRMKDDGKRGITPLEIAQWAGLFDQPYLEVARRFGFDIPDPPIVPPAMTTVWGSVNEEGYIAPLAAHEIQKVLTPPLLGPRSAAVRVETAHTGAAVFQGAILFYEKAEGVSPRAENRLSVVEFADRGAGGGAGALVGLLTRGTFGRYRVVALGGIATPIESSQLVSAWPIRWQWID